MQCQVEGVGVCAATRYGLSLIFLLDASGFAGGMIHWQEWLAPTRLCGLCATGRCVNEKWDPGGTQAGPL